MACREITLLIYVWPVLVWLLLMSAWNYISDDVKPKINITLLPSIDKFLTLGQYPFIFRAFRYTSPWVALFASIPYLFHFIIIVIFGIVVFIDVYKKSNRCKTLVRWRLSLYLWCFGMVNLIGVFVQFMFPTAPPWWYEMHSPPASYNGTFGNPAVLASVDEFLELQIFHNLYSKSTIVFGSFPSLHASWPVLVCYFTITKRHAIRRILWPIYLAWIWWAALYLKHHFICDILGGIGITIAVLWLQKKLFVKPKCHLISRGGRVSFIDDDDDEEDPYNKSSRLFHHCNAITVTTSEPSFVNGLAGELVPCGHSHAAFSRFAAKSTLSTYLQKSAYQDRHSSSPQE